MTDSVLVAQEDRVRTITLNRPESLNALTVESMGELALALEAAGADPTIRLRLGNFQLPQARAEARPDRKGRVLAEVARTRSRAPQAVAGGSRQRSRW